MPDHLARLRYDDLVKGRDVVMEKITSLIKR